MRDYLARMQPSFRDAGTPSGVPHSADCAIRHAAWSYGRRLLPERGGFASLFDALQLHACGIERQVTAPADHLSMSNTVVPLPKDQPVLLVGALPEANEQQESLSVYTDLHEALAASRRLRHKLPAGSPITIALRGGTHYLRKTLQLSPLDSGLTLRSYPSEVAFVSGGEPLLIREWRRSSHCGTATLGCWEADLSAMTAAGSLADGMHGLRLDGVPQTRARFPDASPRHDGISGWVTSTTHWLHRGVHPMNGVPGGWPPTGMAPTSHVVTAADWPEVEWPMTIRTHHNRVAAANASSSANDMNAGGAAGRDAPVGSSSSSSRDGMRRSGRRLGSSSSMLRGRGCHLGHGCWTGQGAWGEFWIGVGGTCVDRSPPAGYWCAQGHPLEGSYPAPRVTLKSPCPTPRTASPCPHRCAPGAPRLIHPPDHPSGVVLDPATLPKMRLPYANASGALLHAWRPGHWYTNTFEVGPWSTTGTEGGRATLHFARGGTQGAPGTTVGDAWFIEGVHCSSWPSRMCPTCARALPSVARVPAVRFAVIVRPRACTCRCA